MIAMTNGKWKIPRTDLIPKVDQLAISLHSKTTTFLLSKDISWQSDWFCDPLATEKTESGPVAKSISEFKLSLKRPKRWLCGLNLAGVAIQQKGLDCRLRCG